MIKRSLFLLTLLCFIIACENETTIGDGLLDDERFDLGFKSDFEITSSHIQYDSVISFQPSLGQSIFSVGQLDDPIFGQKEVAAYFEVDFNEVLSIPDFTDKELDSAVLVLTYDSLGYYGDPSAIHKIQVRAINGTYDDSSDTIYITDDTDVLPDVIGEAELTYRPSDSLTIISHGDSSDLRLPAQVRIRLNDDWARALFENEVAYESQESLDDFFKGLMISNIPSSSALFGLNLGNTANASSGLNKLQFYHTQGDTTKSIYAFRFTGVRAATVDRMIEGSDAERYVLDGGGDVMVMEAHAGYLPQITFGDLSFLEDKIINHALLKVTGADLMDDDLGTYSLPIQILIQKRNDNGRLGSIEDITDITALRLSLSELYGGVPITENGTTTYTMNITKHLKDIVEGNIEDKSVYLSPISRSQLPNRALFYGAEHDTNPIVLEVTYTLK